MIGERICAACTLALVLAGCGGATSNVAGPEAPAPATAPSPSTGEQSQGATDESPPSAEPTEKTKSAASESPTERLMREHFAAAKSIRQAVITGKQEDIFKPARTLVYLSDVKELPPEWQVPVARMQDAAERLKASQDMVTAAAATADIGTSCGQCHEALGGPSATPLEPPRSDGSVQTRMQQHAWAAERLWEGLYVPSKEAWDAGLAMLHDDPFPKEILDKKGGYAKTAAQDFAKVVAAAPHAAKTEDKAATYAKLLATCAVCHLATE